jgi:hypothetical protein
VDDTDMMYMIPDLVCPECAVVVHCDYSRSYLQEKALVDREVEISHHTATDWHMHTVALTPNQINYIKDLLANRRAGGTRIG